jgi:hypothetical protein
MSADDTKSDVMKAIDGGACEERQRNIGIV